MDKFSTAAGFIGAAAAIVSAAWWLLFPRFRDAIEAIVAQAEALRRLEDRIAHLETALESLLAPDNLPERAQLLALIAALAPAEEEPRS